MEPMKFVCLLLVLIISSTAWLSLAHPSQDTKAAGKEAANASTVSSAKGLLEDERRAALTAYINKIKIKGRKMQAMGNNIGKRDQKKELHGAVAGARRTTSNISSSNQVGGKYEGHEEGKKGSTRSSVEHEQNVYRSSEQIDHDEAAGFVAFNADYHEPRHHPPKNN